MPRLNRIYNKFTYQRHTADTMRIDNPSSEFLTATLYAVFFIFVSFGTGMMIRSNPLPILGAASFVDDFWYVVIFKALFLLTIPMVWFYNKGYTLRDLMPGWELNKRTIITITICLFAGFSINLLQKRHELIFEAFNSFTTLQLIPRLALGITIPLLQAGFPEEFAFRGILQTRIEKIFGRIPAILAATLLFAAWHIPTRYLLANGIEGTAGDFGSVVMGTGIPVFIVGLIFAIIWDRYRNFLPLVAAHWGIDIIPSIVSFLGVDF